MLPFGRRLPTHKNWIPITQAYFDGVQSILLGDATPQESMDQAAERDQRPAHSNSRPTSERPDPGRLSPGSSRPQTASAPPCVIITEFCFVLPALLVLGILIAYPIAYTGC